MGSRPAMPRHAGLAGRSDFLFQNGPPAPGSYWRLAPGAPYHMLLRTPPTMSCRVKPIRFSTEACWWNYQSDAKIRKNMSKSKNTCQNRPGGRAFSVITKRVFYNTNIKQALFVKGPTFEKNESPCQEHSRDEHRIWAKTKCFQKRLGSNF